MRYSKVLIPTTRDVPRDATMASHVLLLRGGFIRMLSKGIYSFLPLGWRVVKKISDIIRDEMVRAGAEEILMPAVQPADIWKQSGRWDGFGPELLKFKNREGVYYCIGPTHEEVITDIARREIKSYKQLPLNLFQIQAKYRDEPRPRAGLLRCREFIMKDAYSFDADEDGARISYAKMVVAYARIHARVGLDFKVVRADTGAIGGDLSHEFQVITEGGEDVIVLCDKCGYAVNEELAPAYNDGEVRRIRLPEKQQEWKSPEYVDTPGKKTVEDVSGFLSVTPQKIIKTVIVVYESGVAAALVRGDREVNLLKLSKLMGERKVFLAGNAEVERVTGAPVGFAGPIGLNIPIYADFEIAGMIDAVCGANKPDQHIIHVYPSRDFEIKCFGDIRKVGEGDRCPQCGATLYVQKGIEGGQTFYLGRLYSEKMGAKFIDRDGSEKPFEMGCYGIGVTRLASAIIEQHHDSRGMIWPITVAPFEVVVIAIGEGSQIEAEAGRIESELEKSSCEVLNDDRGESPGVKFYDADLIGIPIQVVIGPKGMKEGRVEIRRRDGGGNYFVKKEDVVEKVKAIKGEMINETLKYAGEWERKILKIANLQ